MTNDRIRVLFMVAHFESGGAQSQLCLRLEHLDRHRFDCRVVVLRGSESALHLLDRITALGIPVEFLHVDQHRALWSRVTCIRDYIRRTPPDVVDTLLGWDNTYGALAAALARVPLVVAELHVLRELMRRTYSFGIRALETFALRFVADRMVGCTSAVAASYTRALRGVARKTAVIPNAIDLPLDAPVIGTIGRLAPVKDHAMLLRAARRIADQHPDLRVLIAGCGPLRQQLVSECDRLGLTDHVRFLGEVDNPYVVNAAIDVFVLSSQLEGLPVVVLEAMAAGRPVVATHVGGVPEAVEHGKSGLLCAAGDDRGFADAVERLLANDALRQQCGAYARDAVRRFSIEQLAGRWMQLYETVRERSVAAEIPSSERDVTACVAGDGGAPWPPDASRILIWRLCPLDRILGLVEELRRRHPAAQITCVCQQDVADGLDAAGVLTIPYGRGTFTLMRLGLRQLVRIRRGSYDLVCLPYNNPWGGGYGAAEFCALWAGRGRALAMKGWETAASPSEWLSWSRFFHGRASIVTDVLRSAGTLALSAAAAWRRMPAPGPARPTRA